MENFKEQLRSYTEKPSRQAWNRLESRLETNVTHDKVKSYRNLSVAAMILAIVAVVFSLSQPMYKEDPALFTSTSQSGKMIIEQLDKNFDEFYSITDIKKMNSAYARLDKRLKG